MCLSRLHHNNLGPLLLRLAVGGIFLFHGIAKWQMWGIAPSDQMSASMLTIMKILSIAEPLGGAALVLGFLTRYAAIGLSIIMLGAIYFKVYVWGMTFSMQNGLGWEFDLVLLAASLCLLFIGAGKYSLDRAFWERS